MAAAGHRVAWVALALLAACRSGRSSEAVAPVTPAVLAVNPDTVTADAASVDPAGPDTIATEATVLVDTATAKAALADSAADDATLLALQQLEAASPEAGGAGVFENGSAADDASSGPSYDIDVVTFSGNNRVQTYLEFFLGPARDRFTIWLGRMARYESLVRARFRAEGVPEDMVYLALIESGFSNTATSRAKAVGMWQFMTGTGRRYGLLVDQWVDERRDPFKATDAAARHLADLEAEFGSWYLAAAAYNGGSGRVSRGIRRLPGQDSPNDSTFFDLSARRYLRRETRDYVPKLIAAALIAKEPARYGFDGVSVLPPLVYDSIRIGEQTGMDVLARLADTTTAAMMELNPQYFRGVTPPKRVVTVRVPLGSGERVAAAWASLPANERVTVIEHVVRRGETVSGIAKRYRVETSLILASNPRVKPRALRVGTRLVIPMSPTARASRGRGFTTATAAPVAEIVVPRPAEAGPSRYHIVKRGESLARIARRYRVTVTDLRTWNDIAREDRLVTGERLLVAPPRAVTADTAPAEAVQD